MEELINEIATTMSKIATKELIIGVIITLISGLLTVMSKKIKEKISTLVYNMRNRKLLKNIENSNVINELLNEIRIETQANRIFICQFHNGTNYLNEDWHSYNFSCTYESKDMELKELMPQVKSEKISKHPQFIQKILNEKYLIFDDKNENQDDYAYLYLTAQYSLDDFIVVKIENTRKEIIGFICANWSNVTIDKAKIDIIYRFSKKIKTLF